jgi:hypothetical protein
VYISHIHHAIENSFFCTIYKSSVSPGIAKQIMPIMRIFFYNGILVTWTVVSLTIAKFKPLLFSMSGFALSYTATMFILTILYDFCLSLAQFRYIIVYIRKVGSRMQIALDCNGSCPSLYNLGTDRTENTASSSSYVVAWRCVGRIDNTASNSSSVVACMSVATVT